MTRRGRKRRFRKFILFIIFLLIATKVHGLISNSERVTYDDDNSSIMEYVSDDEETLPEDDESESSYERTDVSIPEGYELIICDGDYISQDSSVERVLDEMMPGMCLVNGTVTMNSLRSLAYTSYWVDSLKSSSEKVFNPETGDDDTYTYYSINYIDIDNAEKDSLNHEIDLATESIIDAIPVNADRWTTIKVVHDELIKRTSYDKSKSKPHTHDLYGALVNHEAVCDGYAGAFIHILNRLGIYSRRVDSDTHSWNMAAVPSEEDYIDVTWDDKDICDKYGNEYIHYSYFMVTYDEMEEIDNHKNIIEETRTTVENGEAYNYYSHEGYMFDDYDRSLMIEKLKEQYANGNNLLSIRFSNPEDYAIVKMWDNDSREELRALIRDVGYTDKYYYWFNDKMRTLSFGLYAE